MFPQHIPGSRQQPYQPASPGPERRLASPTQQQAAQRPSTSPVGMGGAVTVRPPPPNTSNHVYRQTAFCPTPTVAARRLNQKEGTTPLVISHKSSLHQSQYSPMASSVLEAAAELHVQAHTQQQKRVASPSGQSAQKPSSGRPSTFTISPPKENPESPVRERADKPRKTIGTTDPRDERERERERERGRGERRSTEPERREREKEKERERERERERARGVQFTAGTKEDKSKAVRDGDPASVLAADKHGTDGGGLEKDRRMSRSEVRRKTSKTAAVVRDKITGMLANPEELRKVASQVFKKFDEDGDQRIRFTE
eukprot:Cvel_25708.t1-p1 / transcript=Cvel_25708.t1 / gene=Cvel_25708 / organism=Chromera_velia_CCMP2878 / gene_product=hypothetical protein / transcript_product=hypothetical protein / location=Cvel_scaffold2950:18562-21343(+) / protein_length=313 / sequence_SO=supercontig / SO=protein_coding / is_pseudo=false